ncbi:hypothetical protein FE904_08005 [Chryseobacterium indologenes]|uniref:hypothetical protein n=1 Tax=Chryseobacterium indologenes TaxID=253 RepID=UPI000F513D42|nr:hypothetical protein [Chryseobacterium indologenes]QIX80155.1 hypothetical protein FOB56_02345 [Chryseobacterium indologenes]TLX26087.1 hypothetical protein FE904_08005 [Chryseobacterium indologenes]UDQ53802.1 hypothetical protein LJF28_20625 [Chryseobacterium indologenes]
MKNYFYIVCMFTILLAIPVNAQVGINTSTPSASSVLDITSSNKGVLFPQYDLTVLNSTATPIANPADGLMIYNKGGASTFPKGYYIWIRNQWQRAILSGSEPQAMSLIINSGVLIPTGSTNNTLANFSVAANKITGASLGADNSTITLPAGTYILRYSVDSSNGGNNNGTANTQYLSQNFTCTRSYMINAATGTNITETNRMCQLSSSFTFFQGSYFLTLAAPTTIRQKFEFDTGNGFTASNLNIRSSLALIITKMSQ